MTYDKAPLMINTLLTMIRKTNQFVTVSSDLTTEDIQTIIPAFVNTEKKLINCRIFYQFPIDSVPSGNGRRIKLTSLNASIRISMRSRINANRGINGKAAENMTT